MISVANGTNSVPQTLHNRGFKSLVADAAPALAVSSGSDQRPLLELVARYLFPEPEGWITEWTGPHGYDVIYDAITTTKTPLNHNEVSLVVQYLKKSDVFGLAELEKAAKGENELRSLLFGQTYLGKFLFGEKTYNPQKSLPLEIDDEMQAPLFQYFDFETLQAFPNFRKVTQLYSLYWRPAGITANLANQLAKKHGQKFHCEDCWKWARHGDISASIDCWVGFPNDVFGRNKSVREQHALVPQNYEFPHILDIVFCVFMKSICTGTKILSANPLTYTRCQERSHSWPLAIGNFFEGGLHIIRGSLPNEETGVAPVRKFC